MSHQKTNTTNNTKHNKQSHKRHMVSLVFKWGSLVGLSLPSTSGLNGTTPFVAGDVVFRPKEFTGAITDDWTSVPWCTTDFGNYGNTATDHLSQVHNPTTGVGDICRYMGVVDGTCWRMPTQSEWNELYGSAEADKGQAVKLGGGWIIGNYYPLSGYAFGPGRSDVSISGNGADARVTSADPNTNGTVFLPASGYRYPTAGAIYNIGIEGDYWSSTASTAGAGYDMWFNSSNVYPQYSNHRTYGFGVRCIRE